MASFEIIQDLVNLIQVQRQDIKKQSIETCFSLTSDPEMCRMFVKAEAIKPLCRLTAEPAVAGEAISTLINIGAEVPNSIDAMIDASIVNRLMETIVDKNSEHHKLALMLLVNVTTSRKGAESMMQTATPSLEGLHLRRLLRALAQHPGPPAAGEGAGDAWAHAATVVGNVTQVPSGRAALADRAVGLLRGLVPELAGPAEGGGGGAAAAGLSIRRRGVLAAVKNVCFNEEHHEWLLSSEVNLVPNLLVAVGGPEEYTLEEKVALDPRVWRAGAAKRRDPDREVWKAALEVLLLLCTSAAGRAALRALGAFPVVRHLDNAANRDGERYDDEEIGELVYQVVNFLMRDEEDTRDGQNNESKHSEEHDQKQGTPKKENQGIDCDSDSAAAGTNQMGSPPIICHSDERRIEEEQEEEENIINDNDGGSKKQQQHQQQQQKQKQPGDDSIHSSSDNNDKRSSSSVSSNHIMHDDAATKRTEEEKKNKKEEIKEFEEDDDGKEEHNNDCDDLDNID